MGRLCSEPADEQALALEWAGRNSACESGSELASAESWDT